jgi:tripartite-type tricarboxylate transporter receptor subunit TctC
VVRTDHPARSLAELIALAKQGTRMSYASAGAGTTMHIAAEMLNAAAGTRITHVPYRGAAPAINDLLGGHIDTMNADLPVLLPIVEAGKARALVLCASERTPLLPDLPTSAELGYPDVIMENWYGLLAPAGIAPQLLAALEKAVLEIVQVPLVAKRLAAGGIRGEMDGQAFKARIERELDYWGPEIRRLGITAE